MKNAKKILQEHGFVLKKKFGQNFITNDAVLIEIVNQAQIQPDDRVIEIGPGAGALTAKLAMAAKSVTAIEIDSTLQPVLEETLQDYKNVELIFADILKWDLKKYLEQKYPTENMKVVANLPYYITTPIIMKLLEEKLPLQSITIMVQKEVADRMQAQPGGKDYGALTLAIAYYAKAEIVMTVPPHIFLPPPKVMSAVIHLQLKQSSRQQSKMAALPEAVNSNFNLSEKQEKWLFQVIGAAFEQRRKTLLNALANKGIADKEQIRQALGTIDLPENIRGERLSLEDFIQLSKLLAKN